MIQELVVETNDELVLPPHVDIPDSPRFVKHETYFYDVALIFGEKSLKHSVIGRSNQAKI